VPFIQHSFSEFHLPGRTSLADAQTVFSADHVLITSELENHVCSLVPLYCHIYVDVPELSSLLSPSSSSLQWAGCLRSSLFNRILKLLGSRKRRSLAAEVGRLRAVKTESEQKVMRAAADISAKAHTKVRFEQMAFRQW
jgi:intermediate cleaving peptidase 55